MSNLITNINQASSDFNNIKQAIINKGVEVPQGTPTSEYGELIGNISGGGDTISNILPHADGLTRYFDYQKNINETTWIDIVQGYQIETDIVHNDEYAMMSGNSALMFDLIPNDAFTVYVVSKTQNTSPTQMLYCGFGRDEGDKWLGFATDENNKLKFLIIKQNGADYTTNIDSDAYHILCLSYFGRQIHCYVDGIKVHTATQYADMNIFGRFLIGETTETRKAFFKDIAFFKDVAHSSDFVVENTQYLAQKHGIII